MYYMEVLEKIVRLKGNCLSVLICTHCPFKKECLPSFLDKESRFSQKKRFNIALSALANAAILDDNCYQETVNGN